MSAMWIRGCTKGLAIGLALSVACSTGGAPPPPVAPVSITINSMQYFEEPAVAGIVSTFTDQFTWFSDVNTIFGSTAGLGFNFQLYNAHMPPPDTLNPQNPWPAPTPDNVQFYSDYARRFRTDGVDFSTFFVSTATGNNPGSCGDPFTYGVTLTESSAGEPVMTDPMLRYTFMFMKDAQKESDVCGWFNTQEANFLNLALSHELGHQRASLHHPDDPSGLYRSEHQPLTGFDFDLMLSHVTPDSAVRDRYPRFCTFAPTPIDGDHTSCQGNLYTARTKP